METRIRLLSIAFVLISFGLITLYVFEFPVFSNTIGVGRLVLGAVVVAVLASAAVLYRLRRRFSPAENHLPEIAALVVLPALFMPLFASLLNRAAGANEYESFRFVSEQPYVSERYGFLKQQKIELSGYFLVVEKQGKQYQFRYSKQPYYPVTRSGDQVLLPVRQGLLGFRVVLLR